MKKISILVPCYNEEVCLPLLYEQLVKLPELVGGGHNLRVGIPVC